MKKHEGLVYSTELGKICPNCECAISNCLCASKKKSHILGNGQVRITFEKKGRSGKGVTVISGLALSEQELETLGLELKRKCACGGTVKDGTIEIQGDRRDILLKDLLSRGYKAKKAGA